MLKSSPVLALLAGLVLTSQQAFATGENLESNREVFRSIAQESINLLQTELDSATIERLIRMQDKLILLAAVECVRFARQNPEHADLMNLIVNNNQAMKSLTLGLIEAGWHEGGVAQEHGIDWHGMPHFSPPINASESVIHPATVHILMRLYREDRNPAHVTQAIDELQEVLQHMSDS